MADAVAKIYQAALSPGLPARDYSILTLDEKGNTQRMPRTLPKSGHSGNRVGGHQLEGMSTLKMAFRPQTPSEQKIQLP